VCVLGRKKAREGGLLRETQAEEQEDSNSPGWDSPSGSGRGLGSKKGQFERDF
jgi:hypothetical protein